MSKIYNLSQFIIPNQCLKFIHWLIIIIIIIIITITTTTTTITITRRTTINIVFTKHHRSHLSADFLFIRHVFNDIILVVNGHIIIVDSNSF